jgi:hypothetical protein
MGETRKIAAILVADVVGYSRLAGADEDRTLSRLRGRSDLIDPVIAAMPTQELRAGEGWSVASDGPPLSPVERLKPRGAAGSFGRLWAMLGAGAAGGALTGSKFLNCFGGRFRGR